MQPSRWRPKARRPCRAAAGQTTTSPGKIKLHRLDKWPVIRAERTGYDLARRIVHASMGSGKRSRNFAGRPSLFTLPTRKPGSASHLLLFYHHHEAGPATGAATCELGATYRRICWL